VQQITLQPNKQTLGFQSSHVNNGKRNENRSVSLCLCLVKEALDGQCLTSLAKWSNCLYRLHRLRLPSKKNVSKRLMSGTGR